MNATQFDVIVVGAGAAGLAAGQRLTEAGRRVVVLEARPRIGGRVHTLREGGWPLPIEAGAEFIHGHAEQTRRLMREAGLTSDDVPEGHSGCTGGQPAPLDFGDEWQQVEERLAKRRGPDVSFADFLRRECADLSHEVRTQATAYVEGFDAADTEIVSTRWLRQADEAAGAAESARIRDGYGRVIDALARGGPAAQLGRVVREIRWRRGHVEVEAAIAHGSEIYFASAAIITLPLGVLQAPPGAEGAVRFVPDPADKRVAWERLKVGAVVKIVLRFREPFWQEASPELTFLHMPDSLFHTWWTARPAEAPILTGWSGGPKAQRLAGRPPREILQEGLNSLAHCFPGGLARREEQLVAWHVFDWQMDPFARGAYAYIPVNGTDLPAQLAAPVEDALFFAGEATHDRLTGTVEGAIVSGYRAADEVLGRFTS